MTALNRRRFLRSAAVAALGCSLIPSVAKSAPTTIGKQPAQYPEKVIEKTQWGPPYCRRNLFDVEFVSLTAGGSRIRTTGSCANFASMWAHRGPCQRLPPV